MKNLTSLKFTYHFWGPDEILVSHSPEHYSWETDNQCLYATRNYQMNTLWSHMMYIAFYHKSCKRDISYFNEYSIKLFNNFVRDYFQNDKIYLWLKEFAIPWEHIEPPRYTGKHLQKYSDQMVFVNVNCHNYPKVCRLKILTFSQRLDGNLLYHLEH